MFWLQTQDSGEILRIDTAQPYPQKDAQHHLNPDLTHHLGLPGRGVHIFAQISKRGGKYLPLPPTLGS